MKTAYDKNEEPIVISKALLDLLLEQDKPADLIALYAFYYYTAKWQGTHRVKATVAYVCGGLKWSERRTRATRRQLTQLGLIEDLRDRDKTTGELKGTYVKVNFLWSRRAIKNSLDCHRNVHGGDLPQGGEPQPKCLGTGVVGEMLPDAKKVLDVTGGPVTGFSEQEEEEEGQAGPAPEQASPSPGCWSKGDPPVTLPETPLLETHFSAHYRKEATPTERENFFGCYFAGAQRLLFNGQLLEKQPLTKAESQRLANDFYNYRCDVHGLHQPDDGDEAYFTEADRRQFEQLALEEPTARFPVLLAVINYLVLEADDLPPGQADAHQQLRMYVWNGRQLYLHWAPAVAALRAMLQAWVHPAKDKMMPPV